MNETAKKLIFMSRGKQRYGTAGTTTPTTLASQGGLLINIDSATGDVARTTDGFIESETYGHYLNITANAVSTEFDTAVTRTGTKTLKLSTTNATGRASVNLHLGTFNGATPGINLLAKHAIPIKGSTKYKYAVWAKSTNAATNSVYFQFIEYNSAGTRGTITTSGTRLTGTTDWTLITGVVTTGATAVYGSISLNNLVAGNVSDAWFDINSMTLEEVIEPVANSLVTPSPSLVSFTAVGSTDSVDTSLDPTFVAVNTYTPPVAISEAAADRQTFVPTKSKLTRIGIYPVAKGTGNWTVTVHNASNVVQSVITIANASLTNGVVTYFNVPANVTALGTYHFHVTSTVADGTVKVGTAADLETCSYVQNYYKPTTNFKASQNNLNVSISADEDGFLNGGVINLLTGTYTWALATVLGTSFKPQCLSVTDPTGDIANSFYISGANQLLKNSSTGVYVCTFKVYIPSATSINIKGTVRRSKAEWSYDGASWTTIQDNEFSSTYTAFSQDVTPSGSYVYVRFTSGNSANSANLGDGTQPFIITANIDVSAYSRLKNYPTNKDIIKQYATTLGAPTTSATYRATKWGFPAIEYSATEYQYLDVDTTATGSTVAFSELGTTYTTVADGASLAISSTSTPNLFVKANITANRLYSSSNDFNASSDKDGSLKQTITYQVVQ